MATFTNLRPTAGTGTVIQNSVVDYLRGASTWTIGSARTTTIPDYMNEDVTATPASGDTGISILAGANLTSEARMGLDSVPADFGSISSPITARFSTAQYATYVDDVANLSITIYASNGTTVYASTVTLADYNGTTWTTPIGYNRTASMTVTAAGLAASKADWDNAILDVTITDAKNKGADGAAIILVDIEFEGTYTAAAPPVTINPVGSTSGSVSDTAQLTVSWQPVTVNPVESTAGSVSDVAQLTATWLPMTVDPVGSTSGSISDVAQLTVTDPPMTVNPVGSTSGSISDVAQLTVSAAPATVTINPVGSTSGAISDSALLTSPGTPLAVSDLAGVPGSSGIVNLTWSEPVGVQ